jgi:thiamine-phosphate pyrophosphorylase
MDDRLAAWARSVNARRRTPPLWLFTDAARMPDICSVIGQLPRGLCGVVFRHDGQPGRAELGAMVATLCRRRGLALSVAGDGRLAARLRAGAHLRGGRWPDLRRPRGLITSSAHDVGEVIRARRAGAHAIFCSPVFATASHPGGRALGLFGYLRLAHRAGPGKAYALGGIGGRDIRRLGRICAGAGAIDAFLCTRRHQESQPDRE